MDYRCRFCKSWGFPMADGTYWNLGKLSEVHGRRCAKATKQTKYIALQSRINRWNLRAQTEAALKAFQSNNGLTVNGRLDWNTFQN